MPISHISVTKNIKCETPTYSLPHTFYVNRRESRSAYNRLGLGTASVRSWIAITDDGDIINEQDAFHEVEFGQAMLVEVIRSPVVHWHDQAPELDLRSTIFLGSIPLLELNQIVADALPFGLLDFDGNPGVGVVEVDTVIKS